MFNSLKLENGMVVAPMYSVSPVAYQDAIAGIQEATMEIFVESDNGAKESFIERAKRVIKTIIEKVVGFFRYWIARIRGFKNEKTKKIMQDRAKILAFDNEHMEVSLPEKIFSPNRGLTPDKVFAHISAIFRGVNILKMSGHYERYWKRIGDKIEVYDSVMMEHMIYQEALGYFGNVSKSRPTEELFEYIYGDKNKLFLLSEYKRKLLDSFIVFDSSMDKLSDLSNNVNVKLQQSLRDLDKLPQYETGVKYKALRDYSNTCQGIISAIDTILLIFTKVYNLMYQSLAKMTN